MNRFRGFALFLALVFPLLAFGGPTSADEVIAKARHYVGKEQDLDGLRSIHYRGRMEVRDSAGVLQEDASGTFELIVQKPGQQKEVHVIGKVRDTVGLDDLTGWERIERVGEPAKGRTAVVPLAQLRRIQANAFENVAFYRGLERRGGRLELRGETTVDGRPATCIAFIHPGEIVFLRSFDRETGRLLLTEGQDGERIVEEGESVVQGIRFATRIVTSARHADGKALVVTLIFDEIKVNEVFPPETFAVPMVRSR